MKLSQLTIIKVITVWLCIAMTIAILYNLTFTSQSDNSSFQPMLSDNYLSIVIADLNDSLIGAAAAMHTVSIKEDIPVYSFADDDHDRFQQERNGSSSRSHHLDGIQQPKYAYVTLLHGVDTTFSYRGFFYNCLITRKSLVTLGSTADFVVLVGFTYGSNPNNSWINHDLEIMRRFGIITYFLDRLTDVNTTDSIDSLHSAAATSAASASSSSPGKKTGKKKVLFSEMALLKITPFRLTQYERIQFFDGDVLPHMNMDCLFHLNLNTFNTGNASPLNSGWFLIVPDLQDYTALRRQAMQRLGRRWNEEKGWGRGIPKTYLFFRGGKREVRRWSFNGASLDQGLFLHYFVLTQGRIQLVDVKDVVVYDQYPHHYVVSVQQSLQCCQVQVQSSDKQKGERGRSSSSPGGGGGGGGGGGTALLPTDMFYHFTGRNKPWLQQLSLSGSKDRALELWAHYLDSFGFHVNSSNIGQFKLKSPLGYFYPNK